MKAPRISVLIPSYNCARYLPEAIESVLEQEFRDWELLIIDDASTDGSLAVINKYAALDPRITFQCNPGNLGAVRNWNLCLAQARGEYIKLLCCDDRLVSAQALGKLASLLDSNPSSVLATSGRSIIDEDSRMLEVCSLLGPPGLKNGKDVVAHCLEADGNLIGEPSAVMFRRQPARRGFDPRYRQLVDLEMWFHLLAHGDLVYCPEPLCAFRKHPLQLTAFNHANQIGLYEGDMLFVDYFPNPWLRKRLSRQALFIRIYRGRKRRTKPEDAREVERQMLKTLGRWWYAALWLRRKMFKPCSDARKSLQKHLHRWLPQIKS